MSKIANNPLLEIHKKLSPEPLEDGNLDEFYVNVFNARGDNPVKELIRALKQDPKGKQQILFSGYRGCGKSTELNKLKEEIENEFIVLSFSVLKELDPVNVNYVELITLTMEKLFKAIKDHNIQVSESLLDSILSWLNTEEIKKTRDTSGEVGLEAEAGFKAKLAWLLKISVKARTAAKYSYSVKKTITEAVEHRISDFISHCNDMIREVQLKLSSAGKAGLLIIIEDLDKLATDTSEDLFFKHSNVLTSLQTNVIFTFPIALCHHTNAKIIKSNFSEDFELPMVKVNNKDGSPNEQGIKALRDIVYARVATECFESEALLDRFISMSGGCIRDLFRMISAAVGNALNNDRNQLNSTDFKYGFQRLKRDYENTIAEKRVGDKVIVSVDAYYDALVAAATSTIKKVNNNEATLDLRQNTCILGYNGEGWCDVHPIVREILIERKLVQDQSKL